MSNYQPTSAPYSADNLPAHDEDIAWIKEFGTETTEATGQAFTASPATPTINTVNARMGMLECRQGADGAEFMSGTTFLIPPWSTYAEGSVPELRTICLMAHFLLAEQNLFDPDDVRALLILAAEDFVGDVSGQDVTAIAIRTPGGLEAGVEASAVLQSYANGAGALPTTEVEYTRWGTSLYVRLLIIGDVAEEKESEMTLWTSRNGSSWSMQSQPQVTAEGAFRRIGLGVSGAAGTAWLDWVRIYNYRLQSVSAEGALTPQLPLTGGRLFSA